MASAPPYTDNNDPSMVFSPALPYVMTIEGGLFPGRAIVIRGAVLKDHQEKRFSIDLCCGLLVNGDHQDDKALHFNPRFENGSSWIFGSRSDDQIVLNSLINNQWGVEERYGNVFKEGSPFTIRILVLAEYFKIAVDGKHLGDFLFRLPVERAKILYIKGNVLIDSIKIEGSDSPLTFDPYDEKPIRKPKIPFVIRIKNGLFSISRITFLATPLMHSERFTVNFMHCSDYLFHFRVDMPKKKQQGAIVRNSCVNGIWQKEERAVSHFPFDFGKTVDMVFNIVSDAILVEVDHCHLAKFDFRKDVSPEKIDKIVVCGDIVIQLFQLKKRE